MKLERLIAIIMLLLTRDKMGGQQLADMFEVSLRTIYRDIETINRAGIPIITAPGTGGGIGIMKEYKVEKGIFTTNDITALLMGLGFISGALSCEEVTTTLAKVTSMIPEVQRNEITLRANQISIDLSTWLGSDLSVKIEKLKAALDNHCVVSFLYWNRQGEHSRRSIEPHRLLLKENHWYVQAYCRMKNAFRMFKLSRMSKIDLCSEIFIPLSTPPAFSEFADDMATKMIDVELLVSASVLDRVLDYCSEKNVTPAGKDLYRVQFHLVEDDYGYGILMSFGDQCVCQSPKHVREELRNRLKQAAERY